MQVHRLRALVGGAVAAAVVFSGTLVATSASAASKSLATHRQHESSASPALNAGGTYEANFPDVGSSSQLVITKDIHVSKQEGTFTLVDFSGETGYWVISGKTISLFDTTGPDTGVVFIGTVSPTGIVGNYGRPGFGYASWSATRLSKPMQAHGSSVLGGRHASRVSPAIAAAGTYTGQFPDVSISDTMTVTNDTLSHKEGTFTLAALGDSGNWVVMGKQFAMGVTSGIDTGIVFVGTLNSAGISSAAKPGAYARGFIATWYATKP